MFIQFQDPNCFSDSRVDDSKNTIYGQFKSMTNGTNVDFEVFEKLAITLKDKYLKFLIERKKSNSCINLNEYEYFLDEIENHYDIYLEFFNDLINKIR
jgi:hypothetical protein